MADENDELQEEITNEIDEITIEEIINENDELSFEEIINEIDEIELNSKLQCLFAIFPNKDFEYLKSKSKEFLGKDEEFQIFIDEELVNNNDVPSTSGDIVTDESTNSKQGEQKVSLLNTTSLETFQYSLEAFLKKFKDPLEYFNNYNRGQEYKEKVFEYLKDRFRDITNERIQSVVNYCNYNLLISTTCLEETPPLPNFFNDVPRVADEIQNYQSSAGDINFSYEVTFVEHKEEILNFMKIKQEEKEFALEKATVLGELLICECCSKENLLAEEAVTCNEGHVFCKKCLERGVAVIMGDAKVEFPCFQECDGKFPMAVVKNVLSVNAYNKLLSRIQYREVRAANISGIEFCPKCDYGVIPYEKDDSFNCEKCFIKICRKCKKDYHSPRECNESEEEYRATQERLKTEEKETYDVVRVCTNCKIEFIKENGCNKMTCLSCGTLMCYICREVITGYDHFKLGICQLHS